MRKVINTQQQKSGFTLIELIVAISIMMILLGMGLASYINFNERQALLVAVSELKTQIRAAQTLARIGNKPDGCNTLLAYRVRVPVSSDRILVYAMCDNEAVLHSEKRLTGGVIAEQLVVVQFKVLHGGVVSPVEITLASPQGERYVFDVTRGGEITEGRKL